jgi:hypothetical protein
MPGQLSLDSCGSEYGFQDMVAAFGVSTSGLEVVAKAKNDYFCRETNPNHSSRSKLLFSTQQQPLVDQSLFLIEALRSRHSILGRTPLYEWSGRCRDLNLTAHNTHKRQTSMSPEGFEPAIPGSKRPQTHALDGAATRIGLVSHFSGWIISTINWLFG